MRLKVNIANAVIAFCMLQGLQPLSISANSIPSPIPIPVPVPVPIVDDYNFPGAAGKTKDLMQRIVSNNEALSETVDIYNSIASGSYIEQKKQFLTAGPQYKVLELALEKLDLLLHKQIDGFLYINKIGFDETLEEDLPERFEPKQKPSEFFIVGYDDLKQGKEPGYVGYNVENFYQMYGVTYNVGDVRILGGIGASESFMKLHPTDSKANYNTVWTTFGVAQNTEHLLVGFDALFGYSFAKAHREVNFLNSSTKSSHRLWSVSGDFRLGYLFDVGKVKFMPYENLGYLWGKENPYTETGIVGDSFHVRKEHISVLRNQLGLQLKGPRHRALHTFFDAAWVYDLYLNGTSYDAKFVGSSTFGSFSQIRPVQNYGRVHTGFQGEHKKIHWRIAYTGLYGQRFADSAISVDLEYKF